MDDQNQEINLEGEVMAQPDITQVEAQAVKNIAAQGDVYMIRSAALSVHAEKNMEVTNSIASGYVAGGNMVLNRSGSSAVVAGGNVEFVQGGAQVVVAGKDVNVRNGFVGLAVAKQVILGEGARVLVNTPQAMAFGAAFGAFVAVFSWLLRRKK
jgi:hypothetical protein